MKKINNNQEEKNEIIEKYNSGISMRKLEKEYSFDRIWDCGKVKYELIIK